MMKLKLIQSTFEVEYEGYIYRFLETVLKSGKKSVTVKRAFGQTIGGNGQ